MKFTIGQAAKETGKSKSTLSKALKNGTISGDKNPNGSYEIDAAELFRVFPKKTEETVERMNERTNANTEIHLENRELRAKIQVQDELITALREDKKFLQDQLSRTTLLLTSAQEQAAPRPSIWKRMFG
jgi:hypothetical protein